MSKLSVQTRNRKLIIASSGNHAIDTAYAANIISKETMIVIPESVV